MHRHGMPLERGAHDGAHGPRAAGEFAAPPADRIGEPLIERPSRREAHLIAQPADIGNEQGRLSRQAPRGRRA